MQKDIICNITECINNDGLGDCKIAIIEINHLSQYSEAMICESYVARETE